MCTLIVLHRCVPARPLVVAANRDEYLDRPAEGPALRPGVRGPFLAPLDRKAGGTWWGLNHHGVFAGLTNRRGAPPDPGRRSRGLLVLDVLEARSASEAAARLEAIPARGHNPFNLLVADDEAAFLATGWDQVKVRVLEPGVHVVGNGDPEDRAEPKVARQRLAAGRAAAGSPERVLDALAEVCRGHLEAGVDRAGAGPLADTCIHAGGYGTRSSTLLVLGEGDLAALRYADGPPCRVPYEDFTHLLHGLGSARDAAGVTTARTMR